MWRYFDRGLYEFLKHQLYLPLIGNQFSIVRRIFAMFVTFGFVLAWHGTASNYLCWIALSIFEILIERFGVIVASTQFIQQHITHRLSQLNTRRLLALLCDATVVPGIFGVFFFLGRYGAGHVIFEKILISGLNDIFMKLNLWQNGGPTAGFVLLHMLVLGYCFNHVCIELEFAFNNVRSNKIKNT